MCVKGVLTMTLATEIIKDMKRTCIKWKVLFFIMVSVEIITLIVR